MTFSISGKMKRSAKKFCYLCKYDISKGLGYKIITFCSFRKSVRINSLKTVDILPPGPDISLVIKSTDKHMWGA